MEAQREKESKSVDLQKMRVELRRAHLRGFKSEGLDSLSRIDRFEPKIHRIILFGKNYSEEAYEYDNLKEKIPDLKENMKFDPTKSPIKNYERMFIVPDDDFHINIFTKPVQRPPCTILAIPKRDVSMRGSKVLLTFLYHTMTMLRISVPEYTLDLYCPDRNDVGWVFWTLRRNLYVKSSQSMTTYVSESNLTSYFGRRRLKIYERGSSRGEKNDRVRIELTPPKGSLKGWESLSWRTL